MKITKHYLRQIIKEAIESEMKLEADKFDHERWVRDKKNKEDAIKASYRKKSASGRRALKNKQPVMDSTDGIHPEDFDVPGMAGGVGDEVNAVAAANGGVDFTLPSEYSNVQSNVLNYLSGLTDSKGIDTKNMRIKQDIKNPRRWNVVVVK